MIPNHTFIDNVKAAKSAWGSLTSIDAIDVTGLKDIPMSQINANEQALGLRPNETQISVRALTEAMNDTDRQPIQGEYNCQPVNGSSQFNATIKWNKLYNCHGTV